MEYYNVDLYTYGDTSVVAIIITHKGVKMLAEMPFVFHKIPINLNIFGR